MSEEIVLPENLIVKKSNLRVVLNNFVIDEVFERYTITQLYDFDNFESISKEIFEFIENVTSEFYSELLEEKDVMNYCLVKSIFGFGIIEQFIDDKQISEIIITGTEPIQIKNTDGIKIGFDKNGEVVRFGSIEELIWITKKLLIASGLVWTEEKSEINQVLPDGTQIDYVFDVERASVSIKKQL